MPTLHQIVVILVLGGMGGPLSAGQPDPATMPDLVPPLPAELPAPVAAQSEVETPVGPSPRESPSEGELVSILVRRFPEGKSVEMKDAPEWFQNMIQRIVRENVPATYVQDNDWGKTDKRWNGLKLRRNGLRLSTKRQWKEVNHGTWKRYEIQAIDPHKNLTLRIQKIRDAGEGNVAFEVHLASKLHVFARTAKWTKGVQLYSVSVDAEADVQLRIDCQVGMRLDPAKFPPDVVVMPQVLNADLDVQHFRLERVSKFDGPIVKQLGKSVHKVLRDKIEEKRDGLPDKINRQIAKNEDKMRFSIADFAAKKWRSFTSDLAQDPVEETMPVPSASRS